MQLPYIVAVVSVLALGVSLYKDRTIEEDTRKIKIALISHHAVQSVLVLLALWAAVQASNAESARAKDEMEHHLELSKRIAETKEAQERALQASLNAAVAIAAARHGRLIADTFSRDLLPMGPQIKRYTESLTAMENDDRLATVKKGTLKPFDPEGECKFLAGSKLLGKLQSIAKEIAKDRSLYNDRYPTPMVEWAMATNKINVRDLGKILSVTPEGDSYVKLVEKATGEPIDRAFAMSSAAAPCGSGVPSDT